jgi:hypothetical protein
MCVCVLGGDAPWARGRGRQETMLNVPGAAAVVRGRSWAIIALQTQNKKNKKGLELLSIDPALVQLFVPQCDLV